MCVRCVELGLTHQPGSKEAVKGELGERKAKDLSRERGVGAPSCVTV